MFNIIEQEKRARANLQEKLDKIIKIEPESLIRKDELGISLSFIDGSEIFHRTLNLFQRLRECNLNDVPINTLNQLSQMAKQALQTFEEILNFDPSSSANPVNVRDKLLNQASDQYQSFFAHITPIITYASPGREELNRLKNDVTKILKQLRQVTDNIENKSSDYIKKAKETLEYIQNTSAQIGIAKQAEHFQKEALSHLKRSRYWLIATGILGVITAAFGVWSLYFFTTYTGHLTTSTSVQLAISKLIVFSILYLAAFWAGRNYRAQWHNYVVNKHRQNALSIFETFVKAAEDDQTKNAVLLQATKSIFTPQTSGFVSTESDAGQSLQILEIIRSAIGPRSGN